MQRDFEFTPEPGGAQRRAVARIIACGGSHFALPQHTTLEIVDHPKSIRVPGAARHAIGLLEWQGRRIPLIDAASLLANEPAHSAAPRYALVVAMQSTPGAPIEHGAIALESLPNSINIDDATWCSAPEEGRWESMAISCFKQDGHAVPVVDTAKLFARVSA